jgi:hypothetical protein
MQNSQTKFQQFPCLIVPLNDKAGRSEKAEIPVKSVCGNKSVWEFILPLYQQVTQTPD